MIRRISLYGGPGSGKTTLSARVFAEMKMKGHNVEQVTEYVKLMAYEGRAPKSYDQLYIFSKQIHREDLVLRHVPTIVTDCPPLMNVAYARALGFPCWESLLEIALRWEKEQPSLNFFIERTVPYVAAGRFQTEAQAGIVSEDILSMVMANVKYHTVKFAIHDPGWPPAAGKLTTFDDLMTYIYNHTEI